VIDPDGFRPNVGIILSNAEGRLLWARRVGQDAWQFPQGGMRSDETPAEAMYRELAEEIGLQPEQVWFLLRILCSDKAVCLNHSEKPEFDHWRWVDYWQPLEEVVAFKRRVYRKALNELAPLLFPDGAPTHLKKDRLPRQIQTQ
jgi:putative (di)nucleoside polyphosphate hydrolase